MSSITAALALPSTTLPDLRRFFPSRTVHYYSHRNLLFFYRRCQPLYASRRFSSYPQEAVLVVPDPRAVVGELGNENDDEGEEDESDDDDDDRSLDLLVKFLENVFRRISRPARRQVRSVLPPTIPTKLVKFAVNGVLVLTVLWILKAFLEVVCTFGSMVFVSILVVRGVWAGISYMKVNRFRYSARTDDDANAWSNVLLAT